MLKLATRETLGTREQGRSENNGIGNGNWTVSVVFS